jgi:hypothetical protein
VRVLCTFCFNQLSGYDVYRRRLVPCIVVAVTSVDVMHVSDLNVGEIRTWSG